MLRKCPLVVILGSTGTGKTKLSLEIAQKFKGEIIGADSMQVYRGLDIVTAKATTAERNRAPHHLLDVAKPGENYTVVHYQREALQIISALLAGGTIPVVVGGTNYYIESILWKILVDFKEEFMRDPRTGKTLETPKQNILAEKCKGPSIDDIDVNHDSKIMPEVSAESSASISNISSSISAKYDSTFERRSQVSVNDAGDISISKINNSICNFDRSCENRKNHGDKIKSVSKCAEKSDVNILNEKLSFSAEIIDEISGSQTSKTEDVSKDGANTDKEQSSDLIFSESDCDSGIVFNDRYELEWASMSGPELHALLARVDKRSAERLHPNNRRKIIRSLQIYRRSGRTHTDLLSEQRSDVGGCSIGGPLRFEHVILLWLRCDQDVLNERLDSRVDSMMQEGLIKELQNFRDRYIPPNSEPDYTLGILQTIGLKELSPYLEHIEGNDNNDEEYTVKLLTECLDNLKLVTRRYARKQNRWVRNRFLGYKDRQVPPLYGLDTSKPELWNEMVRDPAFEIIESYLNDKTPRAKPLDHEPNLSISAEMNPEVSHYCEICERIFVGDFQWRLHQKSNKHARTVKSKKRRLEKEQLAQESDDKVFYKSLL